MPLSEYEQRVLEELERDLGADARLKTAMSRSPRSGSRLVGVLVGVALGLGVVLVGVMVRQPLVGVGGFALMLAAALWGLLGPTGGGAVGAQGAKPASGGPASRAAKPAKQGFMARLEQRFEKRRESGGL